jgi:glycosyltransferase involved in cell wall biosynthesis
MDKIEILLSTFNGGHYLSEQLESIENQTFTEWVLIARDDRSVDFSLEILDEFSHRHPDKVYIVDGGEKHLGACGSFSFLMTKTTADYVMFCDQDDVWLPNKIEKTFLRMKQLEMGKALGTPLLVHCDLVAADETLTKQYGSFWSLRRIRPENAGRFNRQLVSNVVSGCALMMNRALLKKAAPIPAKALMHDWWVGQVASAFGYVAHEKLPLILYRQHTGNEVGVQPYRAGNFIGSVLKCMFQKEARRSERDLTYRRLHQAEAFFHRYGAELTESRRKTAAAYLRLYHFLPFFRFGIMARYGFWRTGILRNLAMGMMPRISD